MKLVGHVPMELSFLIFTFLKKARSDLKGRLFERGAYWKEGAKSNHGFGRHLNG